MPSNIAPVELPYTLQTWSGMVMDKGKPGPRGDPSAAWHPMDSAKQKMYAFPELRFPRLDKFEDFLTQNWSVSKFGQVAAASIKENADIQQPERGLARKIDFARNINALRSKFTIHEMITFIKLKTRLDLEQAAAIVISALFNDGRIEEATRLTEELSGILASSRMWVDDTSRFPSRGAPVGKLGNLAVKLQFRCAMSNVDIRTPTSWPEIVSLLLRIRWKKPTDRCLYIPRWIFKKSEIEPPKHMQDFFAILNTSDNATGFHTGRIWPTQPVSKDSIIVSRHFFRTIQKHLLGMFQFWKPDIRLRKEIHDLQDQVLYASNWIEDRFRDTDDVAKMAFWFFTFQRKLQLKVVSNYSWTGFLVKGEGSKLYQNNIRIKSTFEIELARIARLEVEKVLDMDEDIMELFDHTCLLMKAYVDLYGNGKKENLVFQKGVRGGGGRGPVDEYNLLCDILIALKEKAKEKRITEVPGPVFKFLAKDIMAWNQSFADDAFANGRIHGWETWLAQRELTEKMEKVDLYTV